MTEKSSLTASAVASKLDANVNFIQGPCRAAGINAFKAQCIPPAQLVVLIILYFSVFAYFRFRFKLKTGNMQVEEKRLGSMKKHCLRSEIQALKKLSFKTKIGE